MFSISVPILLSISMPITTRGDAAITETRPALKALSTQTVPEIGQLVRDLRVMSDTLTSVATKLDSGGAGSLIGAPALPDYKPGRREK